MAEDVGEGGPAHPDDTSGGALQPGWRTVIRGQRLVKIALPFPPPHHSGPATGDFHVNLSAAAGDMI